MKGDSVIAEIIHQETHDFLTRIAIRLKALNSQALNNDEIDNDNIHRIYEIENDIHTFVFEHLCGDTAPSSPLNSMVTYESSIEDISSDASRPKKRKLAEMEEFREGIEILFLC
jgi:hypothetical protein